MSGGLAFAASIPFSEEDANFIHGFIRGGLSDCSRLAARPP
jgi:hypothetical protein